MGYLLTWKDTHDLVILSYETCYDFDYVNVYLCILKNLKDFFFNNNNYLWMWDYEGTFISL